MPSTLAVDKIKATSGDTFTLPTADGTAGQVLKTNASGVLSFTDVDPDSGKGSDVVSADPAVIPDGDLYYDVTGTTNFAAFTVSNGRHFFVQFDDVLTMTHHITDLDLPGGANITTAAGDVAEFFTTAANKVHCVNYTRASGLPVKKVTYAGIQNVAADERILGRVSGADGVIEELTKAQVLTFANVEDGADVTDATNVTAAGALMDSECAGLAAVKATTGTFLTADQTKLDAIEASADVTDATNVASAGAGMLTVDQSWTGSQRATLVVDNDGSFDMNLGQNFKCTPAGGLTLTFTNFTDGQSGFIILVNSGGHAIARHGDTIADANFVATVSAAGTYIISYISDGADAFLTNSAIMNI